MNGWEWDLVGAAVATAILRDPAKRKHLGERVLEAIREVAGDDAAESFRRSLVQQVMALPKSLNMRTARKPTISYDQDARALGKDAAREIEIRKGVGDGEKAKGLKE